MIARTCLSSEGKGRIESSFGKYVFSSEALIDKKIKKFKMNMSIALVGDELIEFDYGTPLGEQSFFSSKLYQNLINEARVRGREEEAKTIFKEFVVGISRYFDFVQNPKTINCQKITSENCHIASNESFSTNNDQFKYWRQFATNHELVIAQGQEVDGKFKRLSIDLLLSESKLLSLSLFHSQCFE